jgi:AraC-like DNA-binding protein
MLLGMKNGLNSSNRYLAGFFFSTSLYCLSIYIFLFSNSVTLVAVFFSSIPSIYYLIGPLSYLYARSILRDDSKLSSLDYLHFVIFLLTFIGSLPFLFSDWTHKLLVAENLIEGNLFNTKYQTNVIIPKQLNQFLRPIHTIFYGILNWYLLRELWQKASLYANKIQYSLIRRWLFAFNCLITISSIAYLLGLYYMKSIQNKPEFYKSSETVLFIILVSYSLMNVCLFLFPRIMYGLPLERQNSATGGPSSLLNAKTVPAIEDEEQVEESTSDEKQPFLFLFTESYLATIQLELEKCKTEQRYLDPAFKLDTLFLDSGIPLHHWTFFFNEIKKQSFIEWKNSERIAFALKLIAEGFLENHTFKTLGSKCGFTTQSTFIRVFKTYTGKSPSDFFKTNE